MQLTRKATQLLIIGLIALCSVLITLSKLPTKSVFGNLGSLESSFYVTTFYDNSHNSFFSISPLNDFYYDGSFKDHLLDKITDSKTGIPISQLWQSVQSMFLGNKIITWNTFGQNGRTQGSVQYILQLKDSKLEVIRKIDFKNTAVSRVGEVINICSSCLIFDDKKRLFFNGGFLNEEKLEAASKLNLTPFLIEENQSFPKGSSLISILSPDEMVRADISIGDSEVFLQDKWHLLEFTSNLGKNKRTELKQLINIYSKL